MDDYSCIPLQELRHPLAGDHKVEFIELFNQALVVKQASLLVILKCPAWRAPANSRFKQSHS